MQYVPGVIGETEMDQNEPGVTVDNSSRPGEAGRFHQRYETPTAPDWAKAHWRARNHVAAALRRSARADLPQRTARESFLLPTGPLNAIYVVTRYRPANCGLRISRRHRGDFGQPSLQQPQRPNMSLVLSPVRSAL